MNDHYDLIKNHNILICRVSEHWTLDWAQRYIDEIKKIALGFEGRPWCRVINMQNFRLATQDVIVHMKSFGYWSLSHGCLEHVFLFSNAEQEEQVRLAFGELIEIRSFEHEQQAVAFCQKRLRSQFLLERNAEAEARHA